MSPDLPNHSPDSTLTAEQHHVLALLAEGRSITAAAAESGVHRNTVGNWRRADPAFAREMDSALHEQAAFWHERAIELAPRALEVLHEILHDPAAKPALRLRVALAVLKAAETPHQEPLPAFTSFSAKFKTAWDRALARKSQTISDPAQTAQPCTTVHNRAPELARNALCSCGSGLKYKRCCASYAPPPHRLRRSVAPAHGR